MTESRGESVYRSYSLWALGVAALQQGDGVQAADLLKRCLRLTRLVHDPFTAAMPWRFWRGSPVPRTVHDGPPS
ncbi:tetratricopeptide repeat protein (plasmid) [Rhodococcus opacus]